MDINNYIKIEGLPQLQFSHIFEADSYRKTFPPEQNRNLKIEITYIKHGEMEVTLANGTHFTVRENSLICNLHTFPFHIEAKGCHEHHTLCFSVPAALIPEDETQNKINTVCLPFFITDLKGKNSFLSKIDEIILASTLRNKGELAFSGLILQLLDRIDNYARDNNAMPYINRSHIKKAKNYIFEHLREPILQGDIAEFLGISPEYLCSVFKKGEGIPIINYINRIKLEQMVNVMKSDNLTLAEASEMYGYSDPNYVSRLYKKYFGTTITETLRQNPDMKYKNP